MKRSAVAQAEKLVAEDENEVPKIAT